MIDSIICLALPQEAPALVGRSDVIFSGVGKINAAMCVAETILTHRPRRVINFGTAGGITVSSGLHQCTRFIQRDMRCEALGLAPGETPFEDHPCIAVSNLGLTCATGDSFVSSQDLPVVADVVDMEAYAIAKVCQRYGVEFACWKYISDQADTAASQDWRVAIAAGQPYYLEKIKELIG